MEIFQQSIIHIETSDFNPEAHEQIWQLDLSSDLHSILQTIKNNKDNSRVYYINGEPGSGCSTLLQGLCQQLCRTNVVTESEILFLSVNEGFKEDEFWHLMVQCAEEQNDSAKKDLFAQSFSDVIEIKKNSLGEFFEEHFKIICIDNADLCLKFIDSFLGNVLKTCKITSFLVVNQTDRDRPSDDVVSNVTVNGLFDSAARNLVSTELQQLTLTEDELSKLYDLVNCNPVAMQLVCAALNPQEENIISSLLTRDDTSNNCRNARAPGVVEKILGLISKFLNESSIGMVYRLCSLRQPLPMMTEHPGIQELVKMKLLCVKPETSSSFLKCIYVHPTVKKHMKSRMSSSSEETSGVDVLMVWLSLVSITLQRLILEAEDNAWAFVPEKWQYVKDVGEKENYNVKELITSVNANVPSMTEYDILQECLYHAYIQGDYKKLAAITFVLDRFLYWHGDTKTTMDIIDHIQSNSPETAISPQLIIRRARFMKNEGNLRGAEATLDKLLQSKPEAGQWKYKEEQDHQVVCGVCVQIKGEIQYRLGHWQQAASLLLRSIQLFGSLPKPDKKGLSSSYGLLSLCLRNMTINDYFPLVQFYDLVQCNPLLAAYFSAQEASKLSVYTPMFFLRHSCQAGEVMLEFAKLTATSHEKQLFLRIAIEDLRDSIQAHQTYKSLTSREQFYILVCACYKVSLALMQLQSNLDQTRGCELKKLSLQLYEHYCSTSSKVSIDDKVHRLINDCLTLLGLESFDTEDLPNAGKVLFEYYTRRSGERLTSGTRLACVQLFSSPQAMFPSTTGQIGISKQDVYHREKDAMEERQMDVNEIVDRNAATLDVQEDGNDSSHQTIEVDRCAPTLDNPYPQENRKIPSHKEDDIGIVDQNAITEELNTPNRAEVLSEETEVTPKGDGDRKSFNKSSGAIKDKPEGRNALLRKEGSNDEEVDRCAPTEEIQEENENVALDSLDKRLHVSQEIEDGNQVEQFACKIQEVIMNVALVKMDDQCAAEQDNLSENIQEEMKVTIEKDEKADVASNSKNVDCPNVDRNCVVPSDTEVSKTVDEFALSVGQSEQNLNSNVVVQSLEDEIRSLPSHQIPMVGHPNEPAVTEDERGKRARDAMLWKYDFASNQWRGQPTMVFIGDLLKLDKGKEGKQRDVYTVEFINQEEPLGKYVAKTYREQKDKEQYEYDVLSQMTARHYVAMFNRSLSITSGGGNVGEIQFLPVVLLQLVNSSGHVTNVLNAEPYMSGEFTKLTNNVAWKNTRRRTDLVLAYSHFTYQASDRKLIVVDIQGWAPRDNKGCTFLTDPQIHSPVYKCFGTGNWKKKGFDNFWKMHVECNDICKMLNLVRPPNK